MTITEASMKIDLLKEMTQLILDYRSLLEEAINQLQASDQNLSILNKLMKEKESEIETLKSTITEYSLCENAYKKLLSEIDPLLNQLETLEKENKHYRTLLQTLSE